MKEGIKGDKNESPSVISFFIHTPRSKGNIY